MSSYAGGKKTLSPTKHYWERKETEEVLLLYFADLTTEYKVSTCWTRASAIKSLLYVDGHDKELPASCVALLKAKGRAYNPKKSLAFSKDEMERLRVLCLYLPKGT